MSSVIRKDRKKHEAMVKQATSAVQSDFVHYLAFWGLALLLFLPPYFRGLHFPSEQELALLFATILFLVTFFWRLSKQDQRILSQPLDYLVLALPLVYLASAFQAANTGLAIDEAVKTTLYFMVYWTASRLVGDERDVKNILRVIYLSAVGVALAGLAATTGMIHINDGYFEGRIGSTFQYANALAGFLGAVLFIGLNFWADADSTFKKYLYAAANFILITVFLGARSQGGFLVLVIVTCLYLAGVPKGYRTKILTHMLSGFIVAYFAIIQFLFSANAKQTGRAWLWLAAGLLAVILLQFIRNRIRGRIKKIELANRLENKKKMFAIALLLALICAAAIFTGAHPDGVWETASKYIKVHSAADRLFFSSDALKMFQDRPWLGWGGGGWREAYHSYQSYFYVSNQVHNYYMQVLVETGLPGLLAVAGMWVAFLAAARKSYRKVKNIADKRLLVWTLTVTALYLGMHAIIDMDLSLSAIAMLLWAIFGMVSGLGNIKGHRSEEVMVVTGPVKTFKAPLLAICVSLVAIGVIVMDLRLYCGTMQMRQALKYVLNNDDARAVPLLEKAISYDPWNADYHNTLAGIYQQDKRYDDSVAEFNRAIAISRYNPQHYADLAGLYLDMRDYEKAVNYAEKSINLSPYGVEWYEFKANTCLKAGLSSLQNGDTEAARKYFLLTLDLPSQIESKIAAVDEKMKKRWVDRPLLTVTPPVRLDVGTACCFLGQYSKAEENLSVALNDKNTKDKAALMLAVMRGKQGRAEEARDLLQQVQAVNPELGKSYDGLLRLPVVGRY